MIPSTRSCEFQQFTLWRTEIVPIHADNRNSHRPFHRNFFQIIIRPSPSIRRYIQGTRHNPPRQGAGTVQSMWSTVGMWATGPGRSSRAGILPRSSLRLSTSRNAAPGFGDTKACLPGWQIPPCTQYQACCFRKQIALLASHWREDKYGQGGPSGQSFSTNGTTCFSQPSGRFVGLYVGS